MQWDITVDAGWVPVKAPPNTILPALSLSSPEQLAPGLQSEPQVIRLPAPVLGVPVFSPSAPFIPSFVKQYGRSL